MKSADKGLPRGVEIVVSSILLALSLPLLVLSAAIIALTSPGGFLFCQQRVGRQGTIFILWKLRTMRRGTDGPRVTAADDARVTPIGKLLRKTKLDELPELWNVIRGDMSLVGPRPEVPRYVDLSNEQWRLVLQARPGLTDPVTLRLRNEETLLAEVQGERERFYLETLQPFKLRGYLEYLAQRSWWTDLKVIWQTWLVVFFPGQVAGVKDMLSSPNPFARTGS